MQNGACAIILAGGRGTRISHLYPDVPKPMIPVAGRPFLEWVIGHLHRQRIDRFVISLGHLAHVAEAYFARRPDDGLTIRSVCEQAALGTGGAFQWAATAAPRADPLVMVNGDSLLPGDYSAAWTTLRNDAVDGVILAVEVEDASRYGRLQIDTRGRLTGFREKQPGGGAINAGVYFLKRRLLAVVPRAAPLSMEIQVFPHWLARGARIEVHTCQAPFLDIGTPETVALAEEFIRGAGLAAARFAA